MTQQISQVQEFRKLTGLGILEARNALKDANWDFDAAVQALRKRVGILVDARAHRETREGMIESYIHIGGKIGVLLEMNCETDFVARNETFRSTVRDICLQIAATNPEYLSKEDVPADVVAKERDIAEVLAKDKPHAAKARFIGGKMDHFYSSVCLLEQAFVKNTDKTVKQIIEDLIASMKENIRIRRFIRYNVGG